MPFVPVAALESLPSVALSSATAKAAYTRKAGKDKVDQGNRGWARTPQWWHGARPYRLDAAAMNGVEPYSAEWRADSTVMPNRCLEPPRYFPRSPLDGGLFIDATRLVGKSTLHCRVVSQVDSPVAIKVNAGAVDAGRH